MIELKTHGVSAGFERAIVARVTRAPEPDFTSRDDLVLTWESEGLLLRDRLAVDQYDERARSAYLQLRVDPQFLLQRSRRPDGSRLVASGAAVLDLDHPRKDNPRPCTRQLSNRRG